MMRVVDIGVRILQPGSQGRAKIKIDSIKIACFGVGAVAFCGDLFIKIGIRGRGGFNGNLSGKRVVARRLIKMPMQTQVCRAESVASLRLFFSDVIDRA